VHIKIAPRNRQEKTAGGSTQSLTYTLQLGGAHMGAPAPNQSNAATLQGIGAIRESIEQTFNARLEAMQKEWEHRETVRQLTERINGLEVALKERDPMTEYGMKMLEQFGPGILGSLFGGQPTAAAIHGTVEQDDIDKRAEAAIVRLLKIDPDFITNLERLADLAENNHGMYTMAVGILNNPK
jgi:hypothetical protein